MERPLHLHATRAKRSPTYRTWDGMVQRCTNFAHKDFAAYGPRGIDARFLGPGGFLRFLDLVGNRPDRTYSLDRIDPEKGYYPDNLRWATRAVQAQNKAWARHHGRTVEDWARVLGVRPTTVRKRIERGWTADRAFPEHLRLSGGADDPA